MAGISFQDYVTPIPASWLNAVNNVAYNGIFDGIPITLKGTAGTNRGAAYTTGFINRWYSGVISDPELGSDVGSSYAIFRYGDTGTYLGTAVIISRDTGNTSFSGNVLPSTDNTKSLGLSGNRWSVVYAGTGSINTSDAREKTSVRSLNDSELAASKQLVRELGAFKFLSAIADKGENAREHIGMTVQRAIEILSENGLTPSNYGFICYDEWEQKEETTPDGAVVTRESGNRYGFRTDELLLFIARGFADQLDDIESRLS